MFKNILTRHTIPWLIIALLTGISFQSKLVGSSLGYLNPEYPGLLFDTIQYISLSIFLKSFFYFIACSFSALSVYHLMTKKRTLHAGGFFLAFPAGYSLFAALSWMEGIIGLNIVTTSIAAILSIIFLLFIVKGNIQITSKTWFLGIMLWPLFLVYSWSYNNTHITGDAALLYQMAFTKIVPLSTHYDELGWISLVDTRNNGVFEYSLQVMWFLLSWVKMCGIITIFFAGTILFRNSVKRFVFSIGLTSLLLATPSLIPFYQVSAAPGGFPFFNSMHVSKTIPLFAVMAMILYTHVKPQLKVTPVPLLFISLVVGMISVSQFPSLLLSFAIIFTILVTQQKSQSFYPAVIGVTGAVLLIIAGLEAKEAYFYIFIIILTICLVLFYFIQSIDLITKIPMNAIWLFIAFIFGITVSTILFGGILSGPFIEAPEQLILSRAHLIQSDGSSIPFFSLPETEFHSLIEFCSKKINAAGVCYSGSDFLLRFGIPIGLMILLLFTGSGKDRFYCGQYFSIFMFLFVLALFFTPVAGNINPMTIWIKLGFVQTAITFITAHCLYILVNLEKIRAIHVAVFSLIWSGFYLFQSELFVQVYQNTKHILGISIIL